MIHKTLILITDSFPYNKGETFIENEISFLSKSFNQIIIVPTQPISNQSKRTIPENVSICLLKTQNNNWSKLLKTIIKHQDILKEFIVNLFKNPLRNKILMKSLLFALSIKEEIENIKYQKDSVVYYYSYWLNDAAIALGLIKKGTSISRAHGWDVYKERNLYNYLPLRKFLAKNLTGIYCISENGQKRLLSETHCKNIYISRLGTLNSSQIEFRTDETMLYLISVGNAIPLKRLHIIGEAVKQMNNKIIKWMHFGDGPLLKDLKQKYPFCNFHGNISNSELKNELFKYAPNALLINTSSSEGIPVSMMEAMSFGIPCIGPNVGGIPEIISDGINGFILNPKPTIQNVIDKVLYYYNADSLIKISFRKNAFLNWKNKYNAETNYTSFVDSLLKSDIS